MEKLAIALICVWTCVVVLFLIYGGWAILTKANILLGGQ